MNDQNYFNNTPIGFNVDSVLSSDMSNNFYNNNNNYNYENSGYSVPNYGAYGPPTYPSVPGQQNNMPPYSEQNSYGYPNYPNLNMPSYAYQNMSNSNMPSYYNSNTTSFQGFNKDNYSTNSLFDPPFQNQIPMPASSMPFGMIDPHYNNNNASNYPNSFQGSTNPTQIGDNNMQNNENTHKPIQLPVSFNNNGNDSNMPKKSFLFDPLSVLLDSYTQNKDSAVKDIQSNNPTNIEINQKRDGGHELNPNILFSLGNFHLRFKDAFQALIKTNKIQCYDDSQDYEQIKRTHSKSNRFVDRKFLSRDESLGSRTFLRDLNYRNGVLITWKRAKDLHANAQFAVNDNSGRGLNETNEIVNENNYRNYFHTTDLDQGILGNCWFVSAAGGIIQNYSLFKKVVPFDNSFDDANYTGAFHFRFWVYGTWKDIVVDDFLPVDQYNNLIFCRNRESKNEYWCALLEKAYAKLCGSYEVLDGGLTIEALIDMSGGMEEEFSLNEIKNSSGYRNKRDTDLPVPDQQTFWDILVHARKKQSVIGCYIESSHGEAKMINGLVKGHAYIITKLAELTVNYKSHKIIRIYNPWGNETEWNGLWSDKSAIWSSVSDSIKESLELKIEKDGEFWISYEDWLRNFDNCSICNLTPDTMNDISENDWQNTRLISSIFSLWQCQMFDGKWETGVSAGGRGEGRNSRRYWENPQFTFVLNESDVIKDNSCWVIISLMQKHTRQKRIELKVDTAEEYIQFRLYRVKDTNNFLNSSGEQDSSNLERVGSSGAYINKREVTSRFSLKPGTYVIIPSCYDEDKSGEFLLRIFTEKPLLTNDCQSLNTSGRTRSFKLKAKPEDMEKIQSEFNQLSIGASSAFHKFMNVASDFIKTNYKPKLKEHDESFKF